MFNLLVLFLKSSFSFSREASLSRSSRLHCSQRFPTTAPASHGVALPWHSKRFRTWAWGNWRLNSARNFYVLKSPTSRAARIFQKLTYPQANSSLNPQKIKVSLCSKRTQIFTIVKNSKKSQPQWVVTYFCGRVRNHRRPRLLFSEDTRFGSSSALEEVQRWALDRGVKTCPRLRIDQAEKNFVKIFRKFKNSSNTIYWYLPLLLAYHVRTQKPQDKLICDSITAWYILGVGLSLCSWSSSKKDKEWFQGTWPLMAPKPSSICRELTSAESSVEDFFSDSINSPSNSTAASQGSSNRAVRICRSILKVWKLSSKPLLR